MASSNNFDISAKLTADSQEFNRGFDAAIAKQNELKNKAKADSNVLSDSYGKISGALGVVAIGAGVAFGALESGKAIIASSEALSDSYEKTIAGLGAGFDYFKNSVATMDFSNFFTNISEAIKLGEQYAEFLDSQEDKKRGITIAEKQNTLEISKLRNELNNVNLTSKQRLAIGEKIKALQTDTGKDQIKWSEDNLQMMVKTIAGQKKVSQAELERFIAYKKSDQEIFDKALEYNDLLSEQSSLKKQIMYAGGQNVLKESQRLVEVNNQLKTYNQTIKDAALIQKKLSGEEIENITNATVAWYDAQINLQNAYNQTDKKTDNLEKKLGKEGETVKEVAVDYEAWNKQLKEQKDLRSQLTQTIGGDINKKYNVTPQLNMGALPQAKIDVKTDVQNTTAELERYNQAILQSAGLNMQYSDSFVLLQSKMGGFKAGTIEAFGAAVQAMSAGGENLKEMVSNGANAAKSMIAQNLAIAASQAIMAVKGIPFPYNIIAAGVSYAGIMALGNSIKFADGGIVPGNSFYGDRVPALLNSDEMVLDKGQQSNLFNMLDTGFIGNTEASNVNFEIHYDKLKGVLNNGAKKASRTR